MRIGIDVDGVLADFYSAYERLCIEVGGEDLFGEHRFPKEFPCTWNWPEHYGYSEDVVKEVWKRIIKDETFWADLGMLPDLDTLLMHPFTATDEVYFITARPGTRTKWQTECWLMGEGWSYPTVLISDQKGACAYALNLDVYVDDKLTNIMDVTVQSPQTKAFLVDRPYNQSEVTGFNFTRVPSLKEALQYVG